MAAVVITTDSSGSFSLFFVVHNAWFVFILVDERLVARWFIEGQDFAQSRHEHHFW